MSHFIRNGSSFTVSDDASLDIYKKLPAGNYIVKETPQGQLYLEQVDEFSRPKKLYGDCARNTDRILNTYLLRDISTGVMLAGEKGSGKSLLAKNLSIVAAEQGIPTIVINSPWRGDGFNKLIQDIDQPAIILFDEFEKVYNREEQESILTLLDGVFPQKKLFVLTCNDKYRIDAHMRNRPGRIFYLIDYKGLSAEFIIEYCEDNLKAKEHAETICKISQMFDQFNFDMLKALVEEMNRYGETPQEALRMLNAKPEFDDGSKYKVELYIDEVLQEHADKTWHGNPLNPRGVSIDYDPTPEDEDTGWSDVHFVSADLKDIISKDGIFVFAKNNIKVVLTKEKQVPFDYYAF